MFKIPKAKDPEPSPFGRQVLTAMAMEPDSFHIYADRRSFTHRDFGTFRIGWLTGRITVSEGPHERKLTRADQRLIHKELETLLTRPVPVPEYGSYSPAYQSAVQAGFVGSKTDWLRSLTGSSDYLTGGVFTNNCFQEFQKGEYLVTKDLAKMLTKATHPR